MHTKAQHKSWKAVNTYNILLIIVIVDLPEIAFGSTEGGVASRKH